MPKTVHTPRAELVCGKLDLLEDKLRELELLECLYIVSDVRHDCMRMEHKLLERKDEHQELKEREKNIIAAIKKCFPLSQCTGGAQLVSDENYNNLVTIINRE